MFLSKTLYPLLSTGSTHPNMTEKNVNCGKRNQTKQTNKQLHCREELPNTRWLRLYSHSVGILGMNPLFNCDDSA